MADNCEHGVKVRRYGMKDSKWWTAKFCPMSVCPAEFPLMSATLAEWVGAAPATANDLPAREHAQRSTQPATAQTSGHNPAASGAMDCPACKEMSDRGWFKGDIETTHKREIRKHHA